MTNRLWHWLRDTPASNEIDRRNGAFFQLFLMYFGVTIFTAQHEKYWNSETQQALLAGVWSAVLPWPRVGMFIDFGTDIAMGLVCVAAFVLVRQGRFRGAVRTFLIGLLGLLALNYLAFGSTMGTHFSNLALMIAALMLGRPALWAVYATVVANYALGTAADSVAHYYKQGILHYELYGVLSVALNQLVVAGLLDQTIKALRDSLTESERRGDRLAAEIVEKEKTQRQVTHLEKMRVVGQLASGTAHDFNNILGVILGFARERRRPATGAPETPRELVLSDALEGVEVAARRGASISRKLLDFSRTESSPSRAFDVAEALADVRPMLRQLLPETIRLDMDVPPGATSALFDRDQFELALLNLAANARDAMPRGGTCTVTLAQDSDDWVAVSIQDTGEGMSEETKQRVFEPFFTTKPVGIGTGLGLSVVHGLVERSGGKMSIESALGKGTTITMCLRHGAPIEPGQPMPDIDDIRVLLIDDDDVLRAILVSSLEDYGYQVKPAHDGRSALQYADDMREAPHVIVCDHHMPDMDGATVMRHLRQRFPGVPAILISTNAPAERNGETEAARTYRLPKPFSPDRLATQIAGIVFDGKP